MKWFLISFPIFFPIFNQSKKMRFYLIVFLGLWLVACQSEGKRKSLIKRKRPPAMINYQVMYSDLGKEISFPLWFNDTLVARQRICRIVRSIYPRIEGVTQVDTTSMVPREQWEYYFREDGSISRVSHRSFFDDQVISRFDFAYPKVKNTDLYRAVLKDSMVRFGAGDFMPSYDDNEEDLYHVYTLIEKADKYTVYRNSETGNYLFLLRDKKLKNPLEIDRLLSPTPKDKIIVGDLPSPTKIYRVENKVIERDVQKFSYHRGAILRIEKQDYPFRSERSFLYNLPGFCTGYIDSVFSDEKYLTRIKTRFLLNKMNVPNTVLHQKQNPNNVGGFVYVENFQYELYP
jgi:hypothetical protein